MLQVGMLWQMKSVTEDELVKGLDYFGNKYKIVPNIIVLNPTSKLKANKEITVSYSKQINANCVLIGNNTITDLKQPLKLK